MITKRAIVVASAVFAATAIGATASAQSSDWTKRVTVSDSGAHVLGNPLAKNHLVEYISYTCNHCAQFETTASATLKNSYVAKGGLRLEIRNLVRDPVDMTAAIAARCGPQSKFFARHNALMTSQSKWLPMIAATPQREQQDWYKGAYSERFKKIATRAGFYGLMLKQGTGLKALNACFADVSQQRKLIAMTQAATGTYKVSGTPSFLLNGQLLEKVHSWAALRPRLP